MHFQTIETTCKKLTDLNFTIQYCEDLGINHIIPTSLYWKSRLINMNTSYGQIKLLNIDVNFMLENFKAASEETGLVLIYASKNL